jgi:hypothetical protein
MVDQLEDNAGDLLRYASVCVTVAAEAQELQQQDRCVERGDPDLRAAVREGAFRDRD